MKIRRTERTEITARFLINFSIILVLFLFFVFMYFHYYFDQVIYYFWGHMTYMVIYIVALVIFNGIFGGFDIGFATTSDLIFSQVLSLIFSNGIIFFIFWVLTKGKIHIVPFFWYLAGGIVLDVLLNYVFNRIYYSIFPPKKTIMVYEREDESIYERILKYQANSYDIQKTESFADVSHHFEELKNYECIVAVGLYPEQKNRIAKICYEFRKSLYIVPGIYDVIMNSGRKVYLVDTPVFKVNNFGPSQLEKIVKRVFDIFFSLVFLILTSPILLVTAIAIKAQDGGPVFYKQIRLTQYGRPFEIIKFRSMRTDAEKDGKAQLAREHDDRITGVGRFIRSCRIDELPQLINILKGDMSVVGPRPERPELIEEIKKEVPEFDYRLGVKAGLTGYAQVYGKYNTRLKDKLLFDLIYIEQFSLLLDLRIMFMTFKILFKKESTEGVSE